MPHFLTFLSNNEAHSVQSVAVTNFAVKSSLNITFLRTNTIKMFITILLCTF